MAGVVKRIGQAAAVMFLALVTVVASGGCAAPGIGSPQATAYCAVMPDSIGLYVGNPVTQMGYQIGTVTSLSPSNTDVRVDFTVTADRRLPADVKAVVRSTSILADRSLELVGNPGSGPQLSPGGCIPLARSWTPKSLSQVIGSATDFINSINPRDSNNVGDVVAQLDQAIRGNGSDINRLLTNSSAVLNSPDQAISDLGSVITNLAQLTSTLTDIRGPLKEVLLDAQNTTGDIDTSMIQGKKLFLGAQPLFTLMSDLETNLGDETQLTIDSVAATLRKTTPHANRLSELLNPVPWWINTLANHFNNRQFNISYRPPLYRIRTPDGFVLCGIMNARVAGSCANVAGQPYAVDAALLQYVFALADR